MIDVWWHEPLRRGCLARQMSTELETEWRQFRCLMYLCVAQMRHGNYVTVSVLLMIRILVLDSWDDRGVRPLDLSVGLRVVFNSCKRSYSQLFAVRLKETGHILQTVICQDLGRYPAVWNPVLFIYGCDWDWCCSGCRSGFREFENY